jgi:hypothetical protein
VGLQFGHVGTGSGLAYFLCLIYNILVVEWLSFGGISVRLGRRILLDLFATCSFQISAETFTSTLPGLQYDVSEPVARTEGAIHGFLYNQLL